MGGTLLATGAVWLAGHALGVTFTVAVDHSPTAQTFSPAFPLGFTLEIVLAGWGGARDPGALHPARHAHLDRVGLAVLALSFVPIAAAGASTGTKTALSLIHLAVAGVLLGTMRRSAARPLTGLMPTEPNPGRR